MSKNISIRFLVVLPVLAFLAFVVTVADLGALAQDTNTNTNANTTNEAAPQEENANANANTTPRRGRRGRRRAAPQPAGNANMAVDPSEQPAPAAGAGAQETDTGVSSPGEAADLSGTYTGRIRMTGGHEMSGQGTLTITGNQFTLESEGMTHSGRIIAITTRGYTGASLFFTDINDTTSNTSLAVSVRARRGRNTLTLTPVPGARNRFSFNGRSSS